MCFGTPVRNGFRHRVRFTPNNILPEIITCRLQSKGYPPGNTRQVFRFKPFNFFYLLHIIYPPVYPGLFYPVSSRMTAPAGTSSANITIA
jgi:hypothetical protein